MSFSTELARRFAMLKAQKEYHERIATIIETELQTIGEKLFAEFTDSGSKSFRIDGSSLFKDGQDRIIYPDMKYKGTIVNQAVFYDVLKKSGHGSLIKETIHHTSLEKWIAEVKEKNLPLPGEDILKVWRMETAKVRRAPKDAKEGAQTHE